MKRTKHMVMAQQYLIEGPSGQVHFTMENFMGLVSDPNHINQIFVVTET